MAKDKDNKQEDKQEDMKKKQEEQIIATATVRKMGPVKMCVVPQQAKEINVGDRVMIVKMSSSIVKYLQGIPKKTKIPWIDYQQRLRY